MLFYLFDNLIDYTTHVVIYQIGYMLRFVLLTIGMVLNYSHSEY